MTNIQTFNTLRNWFVKIYQLGSDTKIYTNGAISVSLNDFLIVLFILAIVLSALINFVRVKSRSGIHVTPRPDNRIHSDDFGSNNGVWE